MVHEARSSLATWLAIALPWMAPLAVAPAALAQSPEGAGGADTVAVVAPAAETIPESEIPRRADETKTELRRMRAGFEPTPEVLEIEENLARQAANTDSLLEDPRYVEPESMSSHALEDLKQTCRLRSTALDGWVRLLERRSGELANERGNIEQTEELWQRTRARLKSDEVGTGLLVQVDSVLAVAKEIDSEGQARFAALLELQGRASHELRRLAEVVDKLDQVKPRGGKSVFQPEEPPLWSLFGTEREKQDRQQGGEALRSSWKNFIAPLPAFLRESVGGLVLQALIFVALAAVMIVARRRLRAAQPDGKSDEVEEAEPRGSIFDRPLSAGLLAALIFNHQIHPYAPAVVTTLVVFLVVIPLLRVLTVLVHPKLRVPVYGLLFLFVFDYSRVFFVILDLHEVFVIDVAIVRRLHMILTSILLLAGIAIGMRRRVSGQAIEGGKGSATVNAILRLSAVILVGSVVASVLGAMALADLLSDLVIRCALIGSIVFASIRVLFEVYRHLLRIRPFSALRSVQIHRSYLERRGHALIRFVLVVAGLGAVGRVLGVAGVFSDIAGKVLDLEFQLGTIALSAGDVITFVLTLWLAILVSRTIRFVLGEDVLPRLTLPRGVAQSIGQLVHYVLVTIGFFLALATTGFDLSRFTILAGALGVGVGFGLQTVVNNFVSGLILMFERPIQVGDTVEVGKLIGTVRRIGIRASTVRTYSGAEVVVPNGNLIANEVVNWTLSDRLRRIEMPVGVAYGSDFAKVREVLLQVVKDHEEVLESPEPSAMFLGFGDSSLNFELRFWTREFEDWMRVRSEAGEMIHERFREAGIQIPFPQRDLHVRSTPTSRPPVVVHPPESEGDRPGETTAAGPSDTAERPTSSPPDEQTPAV